MTKVAQNYDKTAVWQLVALSALDWSVKLVRKVWSAWQKAVVSEHEFRLMSQSLMQNFAMTTFQAKSCQKFFSEYTISSFADWLNERQIRVVTELDQHYPVWLRELPNAPPTLWYLGCWPPLERTIAIVGSRHPTAYGAQATQLIMRQLQVYQPTVVSGFMVGADVTAQLAARELGLSSLGVLGFGLTQMYPVSLSHTAEAFVADGGCLCSTFAPWAQPNKWRFVERNKVVAGIAQALLVTEALPRSGTHITVRAAVDLGRAVGVLPSPVTSPFASGVTTLVTEGVLLVDQISSLVKDLSGWTAATTVTAIASTAANCAKLSPPESWVMAQISTQPQSVSQLATRGDLEVSALLSAITKLELKKLINQNAGVIQLG